MRTTIKTTLITFMLFLASSGLKAQEKCDYAIAQYITGGKVLYLSMNNSSYEEIPVDVQGDNKGAHNYRALLDFVSSLNNKGWEVINVSQEAFTITYFLKKRKK